MQTRTLTQEQLRQIVDLYDNPLLKRSLDRFHLAMDAINRLPETGQKGICVTRKLQDKLIEQKLYIDYNGEDMPEIWNWKWGNPT